MTVLVIPKSLTDKNFANNMLNKASPATFNAETDDKLNIALIFNKSIVIRLVTRTHIMGATQLFNMACYVTTHLVEISNFIIF